MSYESDVQSALFLSDLHLSPARPKAVAAFQAFAAGPARDARAVYILGDLFDWWIGDDQLAEPFVAAIAQALRGVSEAGVALYIGHGNRDFLLGSQFALVTGATLLPETQVLDLFAIRTLLCHGDELCTDDVDYQRYRRRVRNPALQRRLLRLPYWARHTLASWLRRMSRNENALKAEAIMDVNSRAVEDAFRTHSAQRMIHGHTHRPARHLHDIDGVACERWVLADWHDRGQYLEVDATGAHVREIEG
ncbi:MAG: UDP-2,3-diacylglucosamine diphosphatase [Casimicrobiaceae bacterium]